MIRATVLVGGHPFDTAAFGELLSSMTEVEVSLRRWPEAEAVFAPHRLDATDVLMLYDMPGVGLGRSGDGQMSVTPAEPPVQVQEGWDRLLHRGVPVVALHHALAGWPSWPRYADILGGRFHYRPAVLRGRQWPDSGYRHEVAQSISVVTPSHPLCAGLPSSFELIDEAYLCPVFDDEVTPLLVTNAPRSDHDHLSAATATGMVVTDGIAYSHPAGSDLAAWTHRVGSSSVTYIQPGDGPAAYSNQWYQALLLNAVRHAAPTR